MTHIPTPLRIGPSRRGKAQQPRSKYGAVRTTVDNITFHSKAEAQRYGELKLLERAGHISGLELQPKFTLMAVSTTGTIGGALASFAGHPLIVGCYLADFAYFDEQKGCRVVEDVKGCDNPLSQWKRKHTALQYGITVEVVK